MQFFISSIFLALCSSTVGGVPPSVESSSDDGPPPMLEVTDDYVPAMPALVSTSESDNPPAQAPLARNSSDSDEPPEPTVAELMAAAAFLRLRIICPTSAAQWEQLLARVAYQRAMALRRTPSQSPSRSQASTRDTSRSPTMPRIFSSSSSGSASNVSSFEYAPDGTNSEDDDAP